MVFEVSAIIVGVSMSVRRLADDDDDDQCGMSFEVTIVQASMLACSSTCDAMIEYSEQRYCHGA